MQIPAEITTLIERFARNIRSYKSPGYKEAQLRAEFINPFFEALGWDVRNIEGNAEAYKDVIHEHAIRVGGATKAPDYCFRIGGTRKFFVETKKPSVPIKAEVKGKDTPAYQLRRYAWSAKLPLSILTDFEEFAVYDCRIRPNPNDAASKARIIYFTYEEYPEKWDEIAKIFSKEAVLQGLFDKYAESARGKRGTSQVDAEFLKEIEGWRDLLARNIALRNPGLSVRELNFAVQRTIDRIIFLRMAEDRGIETYAQLRGLLNGTEVYARLRTIYDAADKRYNSGLFHFQREKGRDEPPDELTPGLKIDDKVLKEIFKHLYYPDSPYEFSVLGGDILGNVYEQFLGKVIRLTKGHRARVEEKPEVKKAGGVYYTPGYIVDYIVKNTVGKLCDGKTPKQISKLRILDPACGSGSFLIGAYTSLLDWHRDRYVKEGAAKHRNRIYQGMGGQWYLTTKEKKRILLNNIYGVDIDGQAVEVTKLNLLLKLLEGENRDTLTKQFQLFGERALPDLASNIKCGNSLIGPDFYEQHQADLFDDEERYRINVFDWRTAFPKIFKGKNPGFDAVIGNPPYVRVRTFKEIFPHQAEYIESHYHCAKHVWDIYLLFFERAIDLGRKGCRVAYIVPIQTLHQPNCESLRKLLVLETSIKTIADLSCLRVFQSATVKNCIIICEKGKEKDAKIETTFPSVPDELSGTSLISWPQNDAVDNPRYSLKLDLLSPKRYLCDKLRERSFELGDLCYVTFGLRSCAKGKGQGGKDRLITTDSSDKNAKPYLEGREIQRYQMFPSGRFIRYIPEEMYSPRAPKLFESRKIISQSMLSKKKLIATLDKSGFYVEQSLVCIIPHGILTDKQRDFSISLEFILGILNSALQTFYFSTYIIDYSLGGGLIHATPGSQGKLLIPQVSEVEAQKVATLVETMLELNKKLQMARTPDEKTMLQRQIDATDRQIDNLVFELYGLTDEEIAIVEEATAK